jgi:hypothetical protein
MSRFAFSPDWFMPYDFSLVIAQAVYYDLPDITAQCRTLSDLPDFRPLSSPHLCHSGHSQNGFSLRKLEGKRGIMGESERKMISLSR